MIYIFIYILLILNIISFLLGYLYCYVFNNIFTNHTNKKLQNIKNKLIDSNISIDEKKVVTNINTNNLEKKYETITETTQSEENISNSISKLKQLKNK